MLPTQAGEDASQQMEQCASLDKQRLAAEVRGQRHTARRASALAHPLPHCQEGEKAAETAMTEALLKIGNLVHDSVRVDNNEVCPASSSAPLPELCLPSGVGHPLINGAPPVALCVQDNNPVERTWGEPRLETGLPNHVDLVHMLDLVDLEKGQEVAGSRGYYLKGPVRGVGALWNGMCASPHSIVR